MSDRVADKPVVAEPIPAHVWRLAVVVVFGAFMGTLDTSLVNIGLKSIGTDLHASLDSVQWVGSAYLLALAVSLPACSWVGTRIGVGRLWLTAMAGFTVTSAMCAFAPTIDWLIVARVVQGLTAGLLLPAGQTIIGQAAGPHRLGRVMSTVGIAVIVAPAIGPTVGGLMLEHLGWQWLFLINIPFGIVALVLGSRILPRGTVSAATPFDLGGFVAVSAGLSLTVYGLGEVGIRGTLATPSTWIPLLAGAGALAIFGLRSARHAHPLLHLSLFRNPVFAAANVATVFSGASLFGAMLLLPLYFQQVHGEGMLATGLLLMSFGIGGIVAMPASGRLTDRYGGGIVATAGSALVVVSTVPFALLDLSANPVLVQALLFLRGIALGLASMPAITAAYASVSRDQLPDATSFVNGLQRVGGAVGAALLAVILYRGTISGLSIDSAFQHAFWWLTAAAVVATVASGWLWRTQAKGSVRGGS
ncbi:MDR family MFS transporter [Antrihabitans cavernicola]|uniref:Multidrug efflux MFS transporter n=1 Tax=Antrihabitans cavernicola TaxID=2495913 RepID=A0A5A7SGZ5_9NOCA|nr:MDR family MFS transporter [Spelaeibacter cavernicola]KAA0024422.1 multidrug efflux MFS transporter [Spelaeibacter cavernicola]